MYLRPWIPKHAWAKFNHYQSRSKLKNLESQTNGDHSHIKDGMHRPLHFWLLILTPYISQKSPVFTKNCHPKSYFFHTVQNCWNFHSKTPNRLEFEKNVPKCPLFLWLLSLKDPLFFALHAHVLGGCCSLKYGHKLENFVFLKQNRVIWCILLGLLGVNIGDENKISVLQVQRTQCALWKNFIWGQG